MEVLVLFFTHIKLVACMLVCVCVITRIKWIRLPSLRERKDWKGLVSMKISHRIPLLLKQFPILSTPPFYG